MDALTIAYSIVWTSVALYVSWLGVQQRRLARRLHRLQSQLPPQEAVDPPSSRAA